MHGYLTERGAKSLKADRICPDLRFIYSFFTIQDAMLESGPRWYGLPESSRNIWSAPISDDILLKSLFCDEKQPATSLRSSALTAHHLECLTFCNITA